MSTRCAINALRRARLATVRCTWSRVAPRTPTTVPYSAGTSASIRRRSLAARPGEAPPVEMAMTRSPRRTTAGTMKSDAAGASTMSASTPARRASMPTHVFTRGSSVAAITSALPGRSSRAYRRFTHLTRPVRSNRRNAGENAGLTTVTCAPAASSPAVLRTATRPPPTTSTGRPRRRSAIG